MKIKDIVSHLEKFAPPQYQEDYDNSGLLTGDQNAKLQNILITLDATVEVVEEAIDKDCNLIIAHHPIVFRGLKKLTGSNYVERTVIKAIKHDVAIYAIHTNLDNVISGVNHRIAQQLGLENLKILQPRKQTLSKLVTYCPNQETEKILDALHQAGAGQIGDYSECSFRVKGTGSFRADDKTNPFVGEKGKQEFVDEDRVEVVLPSHLEGRMISALRSTHPYEEVAYYMTKLENQNPTVGSGMVGTLSKEMNNEQFLSHVKESMNLKCIRHTSTIDRPVKKVAICGGAGSFLLGKAKGVKADAFITADFKYHEFFDAEKKLMILDIGHYESEVFTKELLAELLTQKFTNIAPVLSRVDTNPVRYFI